MIKNHFCLLYILNTLNLHWLLLPFLFFSLFSAQAFLSGQGNLPSSEKHCRKTCPFADQGDTSSFHLHVNIYALWVKYNFWFWLCSQISQIVLSYFSTFVLHRGVFSLTEGNYLLIDLLIRKAENQKGGGPAIGFLVSHAPCSSYPVAAGNSSWLDLGEQLMCSCEPTSWWLGVTFLVRLHWTEKRILFGPLTMKKGYYSCIS